MEIVDVSSALPYALWTIALKTVQKTLLIALKLVLNTIQKGSTRKNTFNIESRFVI